MGENPFVSLSWFSSPIIFSLSDASFLLKSLQQTNTSSYVDALVALFFEASFKLELFSLLDSKFASSFAPTEQNIFRT